MSNRKPAEYNVTVIPGDEPLSEQAIQQVAKKLKQIDQVQDQIIIRLLECEDKQISGHVHLNQKLGRIKDVQIFEDDLLPIA